MNATAALAMFEYLEDEYGETAQLRRDFDRRTFLPTFKHGCGTNAGYREHERRGERPCASCRVGRSVYRSGLYQIRKTG